MSACSLVENLSLGEAPREVQEIVKNLLEASDSNNVFKECRPLPPAGKWPRENQVIVNPWNGIGVQFRVCFMGKDWHFLFVSKGAVPQHEKSRIDVALQTTARFVFAEERKKAAEAVKPVFTQSPAKNLIPNLKPKEKAVNIKNIAKPVSRVSGTPQHAVVEEALTLEREPPTIDGTLTKILKSLEDDASPSLRKWPAPTNSLPDICKKILSAIETGNMSPDSVPRKFISGIIAEFLAPYSPSKSIKGFAGPVFSLLNRKGIITPLPKKDAGTTSPDNYFVDTLILRMCADGKIAPILKTKTVVSASKQRSAAAASLPKKSDGNRTLSHLKEVLGQVENALLSLEQSIDTKKQELTRLQTRQNFLKEAQGSLKRLIDGFQKLDA